jgi:uncharacterized protein
MTVEVRPPNDKCNLGCTYCYQEQTRDNKVQVKYSLKAMLMELERHNTDFSLFGGEPLLTPPADLERLLAYGYAKYGKTGIQTNGTLIREEHLRLFRQYNTYVGISIDGKGSGNKARKGIRSKDTSRNTARSLGAIQALAKEKIKFGVIVTLSKVNCKDMEALKRFFLWLDRLGCRGIRLHTLEVDSPLAREIALSEEEQIRVFHILYDFECQLSQRCKFDRFDEMKRMLRGSKEGVTCEWNFCDPLTTPAVQGIESDGTSSNCGRTYKDGIKFVKATKTTRERQLALYYTPQEHNGCKDCRFFMFCGGECPGTSVNNDWRNRTEHCRLIFSLFERIEKELLSRKISPASLAPDRKEKERAFLATVFDTSSPNTHVDTPHADWHLDTNKIFKVPVIRK